MEDCGSARPISERSPERGFFIGIPADLLPDTAARGYREGLNPARWKGNLDAALPNASKVAPVRHHAAVQVKEVQSFMKRLRSQGGSGARALEFAVLTAARSGEVRGATWRAAVWTIPAARMKSGREHRAPLSRQAIKLLRALRSDRLPEKNVFPGGAGSALCRSAPSTRVRLPRCAISCRRRQGRGRVSTR